MLNLAAVSFIVLLKFFFRGSAADSNCVIVQCLNAAEIKLLQMIFGKL